MALGSVLGLHIDIWLLILDEICAEGYASLRGTCTQLDKFIAPILWEKLQLGISREQLRENSPFWEPSHVREPKRWEQRIYMGEEKKMYKVSMALGLEDQRECMQTNGCLTERLSTKPLVELQVSSNIFSVK